MYNQPFLIPGYYGNFAPGIMRGTLGRTLTNNSFRGGLFSRIINSFGAIKNFNWSGLINNTSKTLGIINQTIPLVKQTGPMINNMRSMIKIASIFKDETDYNTVKMNKNNNDIINKNTSSKNLDNNYDYYNSPTFFVN